VTLTTQFQYVGPHFSVYSDIVHNIFFIKIIPVSIYSQVKGFGKHKFYLQKITLNYKLLSIP